MVTIIRGLRVGRIVGTRTIPPSWATEENLRHMILMPALRQMTIVKAFYEGGRSSIEIAAEMGISKFAVRTLLMRVRKALNVRRENQADNVSLIPGVRLHQHSKHNQFHDGFEQGKVIPRSKGRHYHVVLDDMRLRDLLVGPSLQRYEICRLYWLEGLTRRDIAARLGIRERQVEYQAALIRRRAANPTTAPRVRNNLRTQRNPLH